MSDNAQSLFNTASGYAGFLRRWNSREELQAREMAAQLGLNGNINLTGTADSCLSYLLTRWHPSFTRLLEPGVKELVERLISAWDCVTYSSCEGHRSTDRDRMRIRNVRIGTRSQCEHADLAGRLTALARDVNARHGASSVLLACRETSLHLEEGFEAPGVDLLFLPRTKDENLYWRDLESIYRTTLSAIDAFGRLP